MILGEWNDQNLGNDFEVTAIGSEKAYVRVKREPDSKVLEKYAGRKATLDVRRVPLNGRRFSGLTLEFD